MMAVTTPTGRRLNSRLGGFYAKACDSGDGVFGCIGRRVYVGTHAGKTKAKMEEMKTSSGTVTGPVVGLERNDLQGAHAKS